MCGGPSCCVSLVGWYPSFWEEALFGALPFPLSSLPVCSNTALLGGSRKEQ